MDKISINLLPTAVLTQEKERSRKSFLLRISVIFLIVIIIAAAGVLSIRIKQKNDLSGAQSDLLTAQRRVRDLQGQEDSVISLKARLDEIAKLKSQNSKPVADFNLMDQLTPPGVSVSSFTVDKSNSILISAESQDDQSIKVFFDNLTDPVKNQGSITRVLIDDMSKSINGDYHMDLTIST